jgi:hypothetical protein
LNFEQSFILDDVLPLNQNLVELFANKTVTISLIESLPKEKISVLGNAEFSMSDHFLRSFELDEKGNVVSSGALSCEMTLPLNYLNPKMLTPGQEIPSIELEIGISKPLLSVEAIQKGVFAKISLDTLSPVPEDWTLREGNEKDPNSSTLPSLDLYSYNVAFKIPSENDSERTITLGNGTLGIHEDRNGSNHSHDAPQAILLTSGDNEEQKNEQTSELHSSMVEVRAVKWGYSYTVWISPTVVEKFRQMGQKREHIHFEIFRGVLPKFSNVTDLNGHRVRGKGSIDLGLATYPNVIGIKGRFPIEQADLDPHADPKKRTNDLYKSIGSSLGLKMEFSSPLINQQTFEVVTRTVQDYIPKAQTSLDIIAQKKALLAEFQYSKKLKEVIRRLVVEYKQTVALEESRNEQSSRLLTQNMQDEQMRKKLFLFHLNKSGAYYAMKEELKSAVVQIVREVHEIDVAI